MHGSAEVQYISAFIAEIDKPAVGFRALGL